MTADAAIPTIAIGIVSRNEARELSACLESVPWAKEIFVLDMASTDDTRAVGERFGATVIPVRDVPVAEQVRNAYVQRFTSDWLLQLDCDERIDPGFHERIIDVLTHDTVDDVAAFVLPFRLYACGVPIVHGMGRNGSVRLFRRGAVRYEDQQAAHRNPILDGRLVDLTGRVPPIHHYAITSVDQYLEKCLRYARTESLEITADELDPLVSIRMFYQWVIAEEGWRDGFVGVMFSLILAFSRGLPHAYAWERLGSPHVPLRRRGREVTSEADVRRTLNDAVSGPLFIHTFANAGTDSIPSVARRYRRALRYRPSLLLHPTTPKALVKFSAERLVRRIRSRGGS